MQEFFAGLFDFSFKKLITPKIAKIIYILAIVGAVLQALFALKASPSFMTFIISIVSFCAIVIISRVSIECTLAIFQIARYTGEVARRGRSSSQRGGGLIETQAPFEDD